MSDTPAVVDHAPTTDPPADEDAWGAPRSVAVENCAASLLRDTCRELARIEQERTRYRLSPTPKADHAAALTRGIDALIIKELVEANEKEVRRQQANLIWKRRGRWELRHDIDMESDAMLGLLLLAKRLYQQGREEELYNPALLRVMVRRICGKTWAKQRKTGITKIPKEQAETMCLVDDVPDHRTGKVRRVIDELTSRQHRDAKHYHYPAEAADLDSILTSGRYPLLQQLYEGSTKVEMQRELGISRRRLDGGIKREEIGAAAELGIAEDRAANQDRAAWLGKEAGRGAVTRPAAADEPAEEPAVAPSAA